MMSKRGNISESSHTSGCPEYSVILAAGKGSRMGSETIHKVCFEINGVPAINRALKIYHDCGIKQHIVIVGNLAEQVIKTVGASFQNVAFVYQREQRGTANALRSAMQSLTTIPDQADILAVAGDRIIEPSTLENLFNLYYTGKHDLALLSVPRADNSTQGRIVVDPSGTPLAIIEMADIKQRRILGEIRDLALNNKLPGKSELKKIIAGEFFGAGRTIDKRKLSKAFGKFWELLENKTSATLSSESILKLIPESATFFEFSSANHNFCMTPDQVEKVPDCNTSVYIAKCRHLKHALTQLGNSNAQQEEYLSDIVKIIRNRNDSCGNIGILRVQDHTKVLGFNNPAELLEVETTLREKTDNRHRISYNREEFRCISDWLELINTAIRGSSGKPVETFKKLYGDDPDVMKRQLSRYPLLLDFAARQIGMDAVVGIIRSPGRLNVMGRHVDHQGGNCNLMTIGYETLMVVAPRDDDMVRLFNLESDKFQDASFSISGLVRDLPWDDWLSLINSKKLAKLISEYGVDWSHYIKAAFLRLQKKFSHYSLCGMDIFVSGNIPTAAGLSSSSSLVVGAAEAVVAVNRLETFPAQLVTLCGEGEWFVGTRGGSADHAAVKLGEKGKVVKVRFFDFAVEDVVAFPDNYVMAVCDSGIKAKKSSEAKDQFNHRICCYRIGFMLIKQFFPQYRPLLQHLRDVNTRNLGIPLSWIYRILLHLPEYATREELTALLPEENLSLLWPGHAPSTDSLYPIRGVVLFGLSEFERAAAYTECLCNNNIIEIGRLMRISHDGDRVSEYDAVSRKFNPYRSPSSNSYLLGLIEDLESGDPERVIRAQLKYQPGSYHCSLPEIDQMVDIANSTSGVVGAQLAGAGLGGCMMVLVLKNDVDNLIANITEKYYLPSGRKNNILVCRSIAGAGLITSV